MAQGPGALKSPTGTVSHKLQERRGSRRSRSAGSQAQPQHGRQRQTTSGHSRRVGRTGTCETKGANSRPTNGTIPEMGIKTIEMENSTVIQTVEIFKRPGQSLGFYIREGNGVDRQDGVFISRIQMGTVAESNGLLHVGDEILSVNSVMVGKLDDVVILMSIPRKLILKIRSKKNCNKKNASCPSLALMDQERDELPVVVLKKGHMRASSASELEMTEKIPDMFDQPYSSSAPQDDTGYLSKRFQRGESTGRPTSQYASIFITPHKAEAKLITGDEIGDSENSSEGSLPRSIDSGRDHYAGHRGYTTSVSFPEDHGVYLSPSSYPPSYPLTQSESLDREYSRFLQSERKFTTHQRSPSKASTLSHHGGSKSLSYASDSDRGAYSDPYQTMQDYVGYRGYNDVGKRFQGGLRELIHSKAKYGKNPRSRSPECYNSDSEVIYTHPRNQVTADSRGFASDYETYAGAVSDDEPVYSVPQIPCSSSTELQMLLKKFNNLSHELQQEQRNLQRQLSAREPTTTAPVSRVRPEGYYSDEYAPLYATAHPAAAAVTKSLSPVPVKKTAGTQTPGQSKLLRKHSADCLLSYRTYQLEDQIDTPTQEPRYSTALHMHASSKGQAMPPTISTSLAASNVDHSKTIDTNGKAITRNSASRFKDLQLAKRPLQIPYGEFDCYKADLRKRVEFARMNGFDGALAVHVLCGQGLKSTKMTLRDLYCVISVDSLNKARTMIRTGAVNFDWDEAFDIELENAKDVSFLIYNWDPNFKHRLCFHGSILLPGFLDSCKNKNIALKMEPKGLLYLTLLYKEPRLYLARRPSSNKFGLFGVDLDTVIRREAAGLNVPLLVVKCLAEVERRGIEVVGIYRLCGSSRRKAQLRDVLERGIVTVDLSAENVSDIHVVTGTYMCWPVRELLHEERPHRVFYGSKKIFTVNRDFHPLMSG